MTHDEIATAVRGRHAWNTKTKEWEIKYRPYRNQWIVLLLTINPRIFAMPMARVIPTKIEAQFYEEVHLLECKYHQKFEPLYAKRGTITKGEYEPNEEECDWPSESEDEDESALAKDVNEKAKLEEEKKAAEEDKDVKGVPSFWLTIFRNVELISDMIQEPDEPALEALKDVTLTFSEVIIIM